MTIKVLPNNLYIALLLLITIGLGLCAIWSNAYGWVFVTMIAVSIACFVIVFATLLRCDATFEERYLQVNYGFISRRLSYNEIKKIGVVRKSVVIWHKSKWPWKIDMIRSKRNLFLTELRRRKDKPALLAEGRDTMREDKTLYIVVPCYKEEEVLPETATRLYNKMIALMEFGLCSIDSRILFVNDGSTDRTWSIIKELHREDPIFAGVNLSRNRGHQNALLAGLMVAKDYADVTISMDADLQDDIDAMDEMLEKYHAGCDIVYGVRSKREKDSRFKRGTANSFYRIMRGLGIEIVDNHADYRLMSKRAVEALSGYKEVNLFLRGIVPMLGFESDTVYYERAERFAGETKYPLKKMLALAFEGITSLTIRPIRVISVIGLLSFLVSIAFLVYFIADWVRGGTVAGWASTITSIWAIGGLQLLAIGIIGEYIGKIYLETKHRPRYIVEKILIDVGLSGEVKGE